MKIRLTELRRIIRSVILEAMPSPEEIAKSKADAAKKDVSIQRSSTFDQYRGVEDQAFQDEVEELMLEPEYSDVETFVNYKFDDEQNSFNAVELQAISRNVDAKRTGINPRDMSAASEGTVKLIKAEIVSYGLKYEPRKPTKHFRGSMSSGHGKHPFAGAGAGGSGAMAGGHIGLGRGPGAVGGGERSTWSSSDPRSFGMGARKKLS